MAFLWHRSPPSASVAMIHHRCAPALPHLTYRFTVFCSRWQAQVWFWKHQLLSVKGAAVMLSIVCEECSSETHCRYDTMPLQYLFFFFFNFFYCGSSAFCYKINPEFILQFVVATQNWFLFQWRISFQFWLYLYKILALRRQVVLFLVI